MRFKTRRHFNTMLGKMVEIKHEKKLLSGLYS
jgi:hypothetical protein